MNIAEILRKCPSGIKLYSPVFGEVELAQVDYDEDYPITCIAKNGAHQIFTRDGMLYFNYPDAECMLFPSKDQRDWNKFGMTNKVNDRKFKPFEKVLVRDEEDDERSCDIFSHIDEYDLYYCVGTRWKQCIPYEGNEHLLGTTIKPE